MTDSAESIICLELDAVDPLWLERPVGGVCLGAVQRIDRFHALDDVPEHRVLAVEPRARVGGDYEKLRTIGVGARVRHRERSAHDLALVDLVIERVTGT